VEDYEQEREAVRERGRGAQPARVAEWNGKSEIMNGKHELIGRASSHLPGRVRSCTSGHLVACKERLRISAWVRSGRWPRSERKTVVGSVWPA
jgi:hypothetical protein